VLKENDVKKSKVKIYHMVVKTVMVTLLLVKFAAAAAAAAGIALHVSMTA